MTEQSPDSREQPVPQRWWLAALKNSVVVVLLGVIAWLPYSNSLDAEFVFDSEAIVKCDPRVRDPRAARISLLRPSQSGEIWTSHYWHCQSAFYDLFYRPLVTLSYNLNYRPFGHPEFPKAGSAELLALQRWYHFVNWAIHLLNVLLLYWLARKLFTRYGPAAGANVPWAETAALIAAAIFAVHPVHTESVTNIVGRADLLALFFIMTGFFCHMRSRESARFSAWIWMLGSALALLLGLLSKESAIGLVALAALYDVCLAPRLQNGEESKPRVPIFKWACSYGGFAVVTALFFYVRWLVLRPLDPSYVDGLNNPLVDHGFIVSRLTALKVVGKQIFLLLWPARLSPDYSYNAIPVFSLDFSQCKTAAETCRLVWENTKAFIGLAVVAIPLLFAWKMWKRHRLASFLVLAFLAALVPTSNLIVEIGTIMAERFLYIPSSWFCMLIGLGIACLLRGILHETAATTVALPQPRRGVLLVAITAVAVVMILVAASLRTRARNVEWKTPENLWRSAVRAYPQSAKTHVNYANCLYQRMVRTGFDPNLVEEAIRHSETAWAMKRYTTFGLNLGAFYILKGDILRAMAARPGVSPDAVNQANAQAFLLYQKAAQVLIESMADERRMVSIVHAGLRKQGKPLHESKAHGNPSLYQNLGTAMIKLNQLPNAVVALRHAIALEPFSNGSRIELAKVLLQLDRPAEAAVTLLEALIIDARNGDAATVLEQAYAKLLPGEKIVDFDQRTQMVRIVASPVPQLVQTHLYNAMLNLTKAFAGVGEKPRAQQLRQEAVTRYGFPPQAFDAALQNPMHPELPR